MSPRDDRPHAGGGVQVPCPLPEVPLPGSNDPAAVAAYARGVMAAFGLAGWSFAFDNARRRLGSCRFNTRTITLSRHFVERNGPREIRETVLHEVAHGLAGPGHGHDAVWRAVARRVGATPRSCGTAEMPPGRFAARCGGCGRGVRRHRRPRAGRKLWCRACGPERGLLTWVVAQEEG